MTYILGIESSCDETAASVSLNGREILSDVVYSQADIHKKYGGVVVGLTLDESGIPQTAEGRLEIARKIVETARDYGIKKEDIIIDVLCMTISSDNNSAQVTLGALEMVKKELGVKTSLGVSNISFGLPSREHINATFYTMALQRGLDAAIINPKSKDMMRSYYAYNALAGKDLNCAAYIAGFSDIQDKARVSQLTQEAPCESMSLEKAVERGMKEAADAACKELVKKEDPLTIINNRLIPVLDKVGKGFETGTVFLPQLLMSAEAAKAAFAVIREEMIKNGGKQEEKGKIVIATVKGDIHDIGKNIVKVLLENYGYKIIDLGKDVAPETIVEAAIREDAKLVGLSALMTTTVGAMEETIKALDKAKPDIKVMVGGAVLTEQYSEMIRADKYVRDAMASVHFAQEVVR